MDLYLLSFNNYYNRKVKKFDTFAEYEPYVLDVVYNYNFVPGDGVDTVLKTINYNGETQPDYALVVDGTTIKSRWFVVDMDFIRQGQYRIILHRDVIVDNYDAVIKAPVFIEKATVDNEDPLIFNSEDMTFNQIKTEEIQLKDKSGCPWIVGYTATNNGEGTPNRIQGEIKNFNTPADVIINGPLSDWEFAKYIDKEVHSSDEIILIYNIRQAVVADFYRRQINLDLNSTRWDKYKSMGTVSTSSHFSYTTDNPKLNFNNILNELVKKKKTLLPVFNRFIESEDPNMVVGEDKNELLKLNGRIIQYKENGVDVKKRISFSSFVKSSEQYDLIPNTEAARAYEGALWDLHAGIEGNLSIPNDYVEVESRFNSFTLSLEPATTTVYSFDTGVKGIRPIEDAPFSMFCMPYGEVTFKNVNFSGSKVNTTSSGVLNLQLASGIAEIAGQICYDLQLVPYCPVPELLDNNGDIDLNKAKAEDDYNFIVDKTGSSSALISIVVYPQRSAFSFDIPLANPIVITEPKIQSQCDMYRMCSPNFNGTFEFNAAKNGGLNKFNVDITYLPFNPYIHVNPDFNRLYGKDFDDARGLVCGGDFSLSRVNDAWTNYQLNNKNYKQMFDRQVQNMNVVNKYQKISDQVNAAVGAIQGGVSGGIMGGLAGGAGTAVGAVAGLGLSAAAGAVDVAINEKLRNEAMDLAKDQFGYQLGNIQAIPDSLAKTTAYTLNNKYFPILEYYTCSEREKDALRNKIKYNGMTVMVIGNIEEYMKPEPSYIKGKLIRLEDVEEDFHMVNSIAAELNKGVYI